MSVYIKIAMYQQLSVVQNMRQKENGVILKKKKKKGLGNYELLMSSFRSHCSYASIC